jgi:hypothetical protein
MDRLPTLVLTETYAYSALKNVHEKMKTNKK